MLDRRRFTAGLIGLGALRPVALAAQAAPGEPGEPAEVLQQWYRLVLELVRHTATYTPPVASRAFAYLGVVAWECLRGPGDASLAGQLHALTPLPARDAGADPALALHGAMALAVPAFFGNTGPTGQRAMARMQARLGERLAAGQDAALVARSLDAGAAVAAHVTGWSADDGGAVIENMGFAYRYTPPDDPAHWVPTNAIVQQQAPLLPGWGGNRTFASPGGATCHVPAHPDFSEDPASAFHAEAREVYDVSLTLTDAQRLIALFWADDAMLSPTPAGHWISIALGIIARDGIEARAAADLLARLGVVMGDAFIACWHSKYVYDLVRPVTYIHRNIDPDWQPVLLTPPFPEYPSGHSTQSGAAAAMLTDWFGEGFAFDDATHVDDGLPLRSYPDFMTAAREAALSRLYGGIHYRSAIDNGVAQGICVAQYTNALRTLDAA
ncbi:MAG: vanadium-dependent haloperoxidase [Rhodobacterales bacterium]|nr:vanadium-dependent haloperoxidase [Rhodobacterales bacterium]